MLYSDGVTFQSWRWFHSPPSLLLFADTGGTIHVLASAVALHHFTVVLSCCLRACGQLDLPAPGSVASLISTLPSWECCIFNVVLFTGHVVLTVCDSCEQPACWCYSKWCRVSDFSGTCHVLHVSPHVTAAKLFVTLKLRWPQWRRSNVSSVTAN